MISGKNSVRVNCNNVFLFLYIWNRHIREQGRSHRRQVRWLFHRQRDRKQRRQRVSGHRRGLDHRHHRALGAWHCLLRAPGLSRVLRYHFLHLRSLRCCPACATKTARLEWRRTWWGARNREMGFLCLLSGPLASLRAANIYGELLLYRRILRDEVPLRQLVWHCLFWYIIRHILSSLISSAHMHILCHSTKIPSHHLRLTLLSLCTRFSFKVNLHVLFHSFTLANQTYLCVCIYTTLSVDTAWILSRGINKGYSWFRQKTLLYGLYISRAEFFQLAAHFWGVSPVLPHTFWLMSASFCGLFWLL